MKIYENTLNPSFFLFFFYVKAHCLVLCKLQLQHHFLKPLKCIFSLSIALDFNHLTSFSTHHNAATALLHSGDHALWVLHSVRIFLTHHFQG